MRCSAASALLFQTLWAIGHCTELTLLTRGVSQDLQPHYAASLTAGVFSCLNGQGKIPVDQVNDDYCDCMDGSDEPGTAACGQGVGFWCPNAGFREMLIPNSLVGDGVCDCCDGSDEAMRPQSRCEDSCAEKATREAQETAAKRERVERARAIREGAVARGRQAQENRRAKLASLPAKVDEAEKRVQALAATLEREEELERQEKLTMDTSSVDAFREALRLPDMPIEVLRSAVAELALSMHEESGEALIDSIKQAVGPDHEMDDTDVLAAALPVSQDDTPARQELKEAEAMLAEANQLLQDSKQESALVGSALSNVALKEKEVQKAQEALEQEKQQLEGERRQHLLQAVNVEAIAADRLAEVLFTLAKRTRQLKGLAEFVKERGGGDATLLIPGESADHRRPEADAARHELAAARTAKEAVEREKREAEEEDAIDYGPDFEYYELKGQCFSKKAGNHLYSFCPFADAKQDSTSLGRWSGWHKQSAWHSQYRQMRFSGGERSYGCSEARELVVNVDCSDQPEILKVEEPSMCKYSMDFVCPQACTEE